MFSLLRCIHGTPGFADEDPSMTPNVVHVISDSLMPFGGDQDGTQLPCSPSDLLATDIAQKTVKGVDEHDKAMQAHVSSSEARWFQSLYS